MKEWAYIVTSAIFMATIAWGAHAVGVSDGVQSVPQPKHPDFYSTACFWLGQETMQMGKRPEDLALLARVKSQCIK